MFEFKLSKVQRYIKKFMRQNFKKKKIDYTMKPDSLSVDGSLNIEKLGGDVRFNIMVMADGTAHFIAIFDYLSISAESLLALNDFNRENGVFAAYADDFLIITNFFKCNLNAAYKSYCKTIFARLGQLMDDPYFQELVALMRKEAAASAEE